MLKWCKINRKKNDTVVWEGRIVGYGKPTVEVTVETITPPVRPSFKPKVILPRTKYDWI